MSETAANSTLAEAVALCEAVEQSGRIYMLAENYPYTRFNLEMQRLYRAGEIGQVTYADGEYNHPIDPEGLIRLSPGINHWRNWLPSTYYCTHALAPLMCITGTMPVSVNALSIAVPELSRNLPRHNDPGSVILCRMDNGAVFRLFGLWLPGHSCWYRIMGTRGAMEITRGPGYFGPEQVRVWHEEWDLREGESLERVYTPAWPELGELADQAGHGGGDFWMNYTFARAIRSGEQPYLDVYRATAMSCVGILAWKSALASGAPFEVPDLRLRSARTAYSQDHWSPWPQHAGPGQPPASILGQIEPSAESVEHARQIWAEMGYREG